MAAEQHVPIFQNLKAWFSDSVSRDVKGLWRREGGREVFAVNGANFLFTSNASCTDTLSIFKSAEFLQGFLSVFHTSYIDACLDMNSAHEVPAAKFIVLPPDMADEIQHLAFVKSSTDCAISKSSKLVPQRVCTSTKSDENQRRETMQSRKPADIGHICSHNGGFVGGLEVQASDINFSIGDIKTIPFVSSLPRAEGDIFDFIPGVNGFSVSLKT